MSINNNTADVDYVKQIVGQIPITIDWLGDKYGIDFHVLENFLYPGHTIHRMHTVTEKTGAGLIHRLEKAVLTQDVTVATAVRVDQLVVNGTDIAIGAICLRPDGTREAIEATTIILACNGYGANADLIAERIPEMKDDLYFGHSGNQDEAILWGKALGAELLNLSGYQGHGSVAHPHGVLVIWALMVEGAIQINKEGQRFSNEHNGYSEQAVSVLRQPEKIAVNIFDERLAILGRSFDDFKKAEESGALIKAGSSEALSQKIGVDLSTFRKTLAACERYANKEQVDPFGRHFEPSKRLTRPCYAVKVTGALCHTQGGLRVNCDAQICRANGSHFDNIFACGGAACGVSGPDVSGYISGNGLLTALSLGQIAGKKAGQMISLL